MVELKHQSETFTSCIRRIVASNTKSLPFLYILGSCTLVGKGGAMRL